MVVQGEGAAKIWQAIYSQSCFTDIKHPDTCAERKVFYRLISGGRGLRLRHTSVGFPLLCALSSECEPEIAGYRVHTSLHISAIAIYHKDKVICKAYFYTHTICILCPHRRALVHQRAHRE